MKKERRTAPRTGKGKSKKKIKRRRIKGGNLELISRILSRHRFTRKSLLFIISYSRFSLISSGPSLYGSESGVLNFDVTVDFCRNMRKRRIRDRKSKARCVCARASVFGAVTVRRTSGVRIIFRLYVYICTRKRKNYTHAQHETSTYTWTHTRYSREARTRCAARANVRACMYHYCIMAVG
ncbi:hypothetical protein PUN28_015363 [Cardiocondyla obscurior]|uniref:Uncharacterized protein n=1 Tax=Cardiocondyla obscurior TaxID=286306 RepID=A0AAW2ETV4_9HYME